MLRSPRICLALGGLLMMGCNQPLPNREATEMQVPRILDLTYSFDDQTLY